MKQPMSFMEIAFKAAISLIIFRIGAIIIPAITGSLLSHYENPWIPFFTGLIICGGEAYLLIIIWWPKKNPPAGNDQGNGGSK